jgi:hypothetical protein
MSLVSPRSTDLPGAGAVTASPVPPRPSPTGPPAALAGFSVGVVPSEQVLAVSWRYAAASPAVTRLHLELFSVVSGDRYLVAAVIVGQTVEPTTYTIPAPVGTWVVRATPENARGFGPASTSAPVAVHDPCPSTTLCVSVSPSATAPLVRLAGQGFLLGVARDTAGAAAAHVAELGPRQWRFSGATDDVAARRLGVSRVQILSDLWNDATAPAHGGYARTPWSDSSAWQTFVEGTVRQAERGGWAPDYWDVWNEPNGLCCPRFNALDLSSITVARWLRTYEIAWKAIKTVDPSAKVIGPSLSALQWAPGGPREFDLDTFLSYAATHGLRWDAISWHENSLAPSPGDIFPVVDNIDRHIAMAKAVMARHPGTVVNNAIMLNEYGPSETHALAGWTVGELRALEDGGVREANVACWTAAECATQLDGLFTTDGSVTATWWAHALYAQLANQHRLHVGSSADWQVDGLATRDDGSRTVRVLLGRHWSCNAAVNPWCTNHTAISAASVAVDVDWPYGAQAVTVTVARVPAGTGSVASLPLVHATVRRTTSQHIVLTIPGVQDGDALWIVLHSVT